MSQNPIIGIVLLAAGSSSRMAQNKLLLKLEDKTLLERAMQSVLDTVAGDTVLVLGANSKENEKVARRFQLSIVINNRWAKGIGSSIKCGLHKLRTDHPDLEAVIIAVCDQPFLTARLLNSLIKKYRKTRKPIVAAAYAHSIGVPVLYNQTMFDSLSSIPDEQGAKKHILENVGDKMIATVAFPKGEVDLDTMEDFKLFESQV